METGDQMALCPDGIERPYTVVEGDALVVTPGGSTVNGTVIDGKFRPLARHHAAHLMWYPREHDFKSVMWRWPWRRGRA